MTTQQKFTQRDWDDIADAVSNSELRNDRRIRLLDKIGALRDA